MVRTSSAGIKISSGKSSKKGGGGSSRSTSSTVSKSSGSARLPPIPHQETPSWQKPITNFFRTDTKSSDNPGTTISFHNPEDDPHNGKTSDVSENDENNDCTNVKTQKDNNEDGANLKNKIIEDDGTIATGILSDDTTRTKDTTDKENEISSYSLTKSPKLNSDEREKSDQPEKRSKIDGTLPIE